jgi:hypothetical protein
MLANQILASTKAERAWVVREAIASARLELGHVSERVQEQMFRFVDGDISGEELIQWTRNLYGLD